MSVMSRRTDGTYIIDHNGLPYHVLPGDPIGEGVSPEDVAAAPLEALPPPVSVPTPPEPTKAELMAALLSLQTKIEAMP